MIFTHYGDTPYLELTLACARKTNPGARLILLGDEANREMTERHGWEHHLFESLDGPLRRRFDSAFRPIQGFKLAQAGRGRWVRYVTERWFFVEEFTRRQGIERFWHFDSDTMIVEDLHAYQRQLEGVRYTLQCNNSCLNGIMDSPVVTEFCEFICTLYENKPFMQDQEDLFIGDRADWAFTEMAAFVHYEQSVDYKKAWLMEFDEAVVFDDAICQEHGFDMTTLWNGTVVKRITIRDGAFFGQRGGASVKFATLNLSWVLSDVFEWVLRGLDASDGVIDDLRCG